MSWKSNILSVLTKCILIIKSFCENLTTFSKTGSWWVWRFSRNPVKTAQNGSVVYIHETMWNVWPTYVFLQISLHVLFHMYCRVLLDPLWKCSNRCDPLWKCSNYCTDLSLLLFSSINFLCGLVPHVLHRPYPWHWIHTRLLHLNFDKNWAKVSP